jgi:ABC-type multidrug transport system permease subunit
MLGKLVPYLCISMTMALFLFTILRWVFFVPIHGSLIMLVCGAASSTSSRC